MGINLTNCKCGIEDNEFYAFVITTSCHPFVLPYMLNKQCHLTKVRTFIDSLTIAFKQKFVTSNVRDLPN